MSTLIQIIPELNFWLKNLLTINPINTNKYNFVPVELDTQWKVPGSILDLLFNYNFDSTDYSLHFRVVDFRKIVDANITNRVIIYSGVNKIYQCDKSIIQTIDTPADSTSQLDIGIATDIIQDEPLQYATSNIFDTNILTSYNILEITSGEKQLLDLLYYHKRGVYVNLDIVDFESLPSPLSKLIYCYLQSEINNNNSFYSDNADTITASSDRKFVQIYEKYILDHIYRKTKLINQIPTGDNFETTLCGIFNDTIQSVTELELPHPPINSNIYLFYDGIYRKLNEAYTLTESTIHFQPLQVELNKPIYVMYSYRQDVE